MKRFNFFFIMSTVQLFSWAAINNAYECSLNGQVGLADLEMVSTGNATNHKTVLITGGAGFIGSNFLRYMFDKYPSYHFIVLDLLTYAGSLDNIPDYIKFSKRFEFSYGSVTNIPLVDSLMQKADYVVHFAAETHVTRSIADDAVFFESDVLGSRVLMSNLVKHAHKVERYIHISTSEVYGTALVEPMTEEHPLNPRSSYAAAKAGGDRLVHAYWCTYDIPAVIVRPFNNYGPQQHPEKMMARFITSAIREQPLTIHGTGLQARDWLHTNDTCAALDAVLHAKDFSKIKNQVINLGTGKAASVLAIAKMILSFFNKSEELISHILDRPGQVVNHISSIEKAKKLLDWQANVQLEEGLKEVCEWYVNNVDHWKKAEFMKRIPLRFNSTLVIQ